MDDNLNNDWREFLSLMISKRVKFLLLRNKRASGRDKDLADLIALKARPTGGK